MTDCGFPVIKYKAGTNSTEWGRGHGESWRVAIAELVEIRSSLMREKNPSLTSTDIDQLALRQYEVTRQYYPDLTNEFDGIAEGANCSITDLVILNNYTDFRDIYLPDEGCSVAFTSYDGNPIAGQTWDMHGSARRYVSCIEVPCEGYDQPAILFSLVGCLGMMGYHPSGRMIGVNNINTDKAVAGVLWPALVRDILLQENHVAMDKALERAPVTSGHCYLLASPQAGEFWEVMPGLAERIERLETDGDGFSFHTNHCLGPKAREREVTIGQNSTTFIRYDLMERKIIHSRTLDDMYQLLNDHENYPKSICSNFQTDSQDPSVTCGGAVGELKTGKVKMWRGDELYDDNFVCREFDLGVADGA